MTGLTAAYRLSDAGPRVDVYERWPGLGGQVATLEVGDGVLLERYYHHLFTERRPYRRASTTSSACEDAIEWLPSSVAMFADGRELPVHHPARPAALRAALARARGCAWGWPCCGLQLRGREVEPLRVR